MERIKVFIFDLDGVVYLGNQLVPRADEVIDKINKLGKKVYFLTNNSTRTRNEYVKKLKNLGIKAIPDIIMTSARATAIYLSQIKNHANVFVIGEKGLQKELTTSGFKVTNKNDTQSLVDFVVVGLDRFFDYEKLTFALHHVIKGAEFIATNDDASLPTETLPLPGAGSMVAALTACTSKKPKIIIGKPNPFGINLILQQENCSPTQSVMIGDRISTDIQAGKKAGTSTILVKTGAGLEELAKYNNTKNMDLIIDSIKDLEKFL